MKLLSTNTSADGKRLICENAVFDPSLINITSIDKSEKFIKMNYDFSECGNPLDLPFEADSVEFGLKLTRHNIHISAIAELCDEECSKFNEFANDFGEVEFNVRMTTVEKISLLLAISLHMFDANTNKMTNLPRVKI